MVSVLPNFNRSLGFGMSDLTRPARMKFDCCIRLLHLTRRFLREEYLRGLPKARRAGLIADFPHL